MTNAAESPLSDVSSNGDLCDALLGALAAQGGSAGNGRLGAVLQRDKASYTAVQAEHLSRGRVVPCRDRGLCCPDRWGGWIRWRRRVLSAWAEPAPRRLTGIGLPGECGLRGAPADPRVAAPRPTASKRRFRAIHACLHQEDVRTAMALLEGRSSSPILESAYRWNNGGAPKDASGQLDHHAALCGDDLRDFVNQRLFADLGRFKPRASGSHTIDDKIR